MFPISDSIKSPRFPLFTLLLIFFTILVFIKEITVSSPTSFIATYALIPAKINPANLFTVTPFVTAIFLHGGLLHIASNLWFLWVFGDDVEAAFGYIFYLFLYLGAGIVGNIVEYLTMPHGNVALLGASGAIAGVLGTYFVLFPYSKVKTFIFIFVFFTIVDLPAPIILGYWFLLQFLYGVLSPVLGATGSIAFWAHVGGFITGVSAGFLYKFLHRSSIVG